MMMFFELFYWAKFLSYQAGLEPSDRRWDALTIELLGLKWQNVGYNSTLGIFTAKR